MQDPMFAVPLFPADFVHWRVSSFSADDDVDVVFPVREKLSRALMLAHIPDQDPISRLKDRAIGFAIMVHLPSLGGLGSMACGYGVCLLHLGFPAPHKLVMICGVCSSVGIKAEGNIDWQAGRSSVQEEERRETGCGVWRAVVGMNDLWERLFPVCLLFLGESP